MSALTKRRWPPLSLKTLLLAPVAFALGWSLYTWTIWPERTIARYTMLIEAGEPEAAIGMLHLSDGSSSHIGMSYSGEGIPFTNAALDIEPFDGIDWLLARRRCYLEVSFGFYGLSNGYSERRLVIVQGDSMTLYPDSIPSKYLN